MDSLYDVKINYDKSKYDGNCTRCKELVTKQNNETILASIVRNSPEMAMFCPPRHLLPTDKCIGTPEWLQYLPNYDGIIVKTEEYNLAIEAKVRAAFQKLLNR